MFNRRSPMEVGTGGDRKRKSRWDGDFPEAVEPNGEERSKPRGNFNNGISQKDLDSLNTRSLESWSRQIYKGRDYYEWVAEVKKNSLRLKQWMNRMGGDAAEDEDDVDESAYEEWIAAAKMDAAADGQVRDPEWDELDEWVARLKCRRPRRPRLPPRAADKVEDKDKDKDDDVESYANVVVSAEGFTRHEYSVCRSFMLKQPFEFLDPIPEKYQKTKVFLDIIRQTKGYGLTKSHYVSTLLPIRPGFHGISDSFQAVGGTRWESDPHLKISVEKMIEYVLLKMRKTLGKGYKLLRVANVVRAHHITLLISLSVLEEGEEEEEAPSKTVEVMFSVSLKFPPSPNPVPVQDFTLLEWKLKHGSQILHSTSPFI